MEIWVLYFSASSLTGSRHQSWPHLFGWDGQSQARAHTGPEPRVEAFVQGRTLLPRRRGPLWRMWPYTPHYARELWNWLAFVRPQLQRYLQVEEHKKWIPRLLPRRGRREWGCPGECQPGRSWHEWPHVQVRVQKSNRDCNYYMCIYIYIQYIYLFKNTLACSEGKQGTTF